MPLSLSRSTISESVSGLPSFSMTSFMMSFTLRLGVKKCAYGITSPLGSMTYFEAVARDTVLSCTPNCWATAARDVEQRLAALIDVGDEQLGAADVLLHVPFFVRVHRRAASMQISREPRVHRVHAQHEASTFDHFDLELVRPL